VQHHERLQRKRQSQIFEDLVTKANVLQTMAQLGYNWLVKEEVTEGLEAFTCAVSSRSRLTKVDELRHQLLKDKCGEEVINANQNVDLATLPPCRRSLVQHIRRCNYQIAVWRRADQPDPDIPQKAMAGCSTID
jgi:hypothetical protein